MCLLLIVACSKDEATDLRSSSEVIYEKAKYALDNTNYRNATRYLEVLTTLAIRLNKPN